MGYVYGLKCETSRDYILKGFQILYLAGCFVIDRS